MAAKSSYSVEPITRDDVQQVMELLKITFYKDEPMNRAIGLCDGGAPCRELDDYCQHSMLEGMTYKAVDEEGNIAGVIISGDCPLTKNIIEDMRMQTQNCKNLKFQKILHVLTRREEYSRLWERYPHDQHIVEVKVVATHPDWRKRGVMNALLARTESAVKEKGIRLLRMDTSSAYSAMSAERLGFTCVYRQKYSEIKIDGETVVEPSAPHLEDRVYVKELF